MPSYRILKSDAGDSRVIKVGFSWPAFLLNMIWLIANGLWVGAILVFVLVVGALLVFRATVQKSPIVVSAIAVAAEMALLLFLGFRGNDWLAAHLESRGYKQIRTVEAVKFDDALKLATADPHHAV